MHSRQTLKEATTLTRKLDNLLKQIYTSGEITGTKGMNVTTQPNTTGKDTIKRLTVQSLNSHHTLSFAKETQFTGSEPAVPCNAHLSTPRYSTVAAKMSTTTGKTKQTITKQVANKPPPKPRILPDHSDPEGLTSEPVESIHICCTNQYLHPPCN